LSSGRAQRCVNAAAIVAVALGCYYCFGWAAAAMEATGYVSAGVRGSALFEYLFAIACK